MTAAPIDPELLREQVRSRYAAAATAASASCCDSACCSPSLETSNDQISQNLYAIEQVAELPSAAVLASHGCGNPTALAELKAGETVLDLGSGGGIDVLLSARRVGASGFAYGLDMTDEMLALAQRNAAASGATNVAFLKGEIEHIPLPDAAVDVVISNCVINLSADKSQVLHEAVRVLRQGGRFAVSDIVVQGELPPDVRKDMERWTGCIAGALDETAYRRLLAEAGFTDVEVEVTRVIEPDPNMDLAGGRLVSAFVRARKP